MSVIQEIKDRLDIVQYIQEHVPDLKQAGSYYKACCPFHGEKTPSFVVNPSYQSWRCFGACADGGDIFSFAQQFHGWDFPQALRELGRRAGIEVEQRSHEQKQRDAHQVKLRSILDTAAKIYHEYLLSQEPNAQRGQYYAVRQRGFTLETIQEWQIGLAPPSFDFLKQRLAKIGYDENLLVEVGLLRRKDNGHTYDAFRDRLMIPIRDERGRTVGFGGRALNPEEPAKYINSQQSAIFDKSALLFGLDRAQKAMRAAEMAVIVEGYMDVIQAHQAGYQNVVAQMGTAMTEAQLQLIAPRLVNKVILALDADEAGQNATRRSLDVAQRTLREDFGSRLKVDIRVLQIEGAKDPDDVLRETPERWPEYVQQAVPVADFVINLETAQISNDSSVQERRAAAERVLALLTVAEDNMYRRDNLQKLALRLRLSEAQVLDWASIVEQEQRQQKERRARRAQQNHAPDTSQPPSSPDIDELPPEYYDDEDVDFGLPDFAQAVAKPIRRTSAATMPLRNMSYATEEACMRLVIQDPGMLAQIKRRFREIGAPNPHLAAGPLRPLRPEDFTQTEYRELLRLLECALDQDEAEPIDHIRARAEPELIPVIEALLDDDQAAILYQSIQGRFAADLADILAHLPGLSPTAFQETMVERALLMRVHQLKREVEECEFLAKTDASDLRPLKHISEVIAAIRCMQHALGR